MTNSPTIKILVGYHKPAMLLKSDILTPIHLGRAVAKESSKDGRLSEREYQWLIDNMIGDDSGDNISHLNRELCELTGIYWAWKNYDRLGNPDYIGFMHYKRHFNFKARQREYVEKNYYYTGSITERYLYNAGLDDENIRKALKGYDAIFPCPVKHGFSVITEFNKLAAAIDLSCDYFNQFIDDAKKLNPCLNIAIENYLNGKFEIACNMFLMKRKLFFEYMEMLFCTIFHTNQHINYKSLSINGSRILAYSAEKLLASYATLIKQAHMYNIGYLPISKVRDIGGVAGTKLKPAFGDEQITVVYASDNNYAPYTAVSIQSLISNLSTDRKLDIIILDDHISEAYKKRILLSESKNASIRFYDMAQFVGNQEFFVQGRFTRATYFRTFIDHILPEHHVVLYLDGDTIILGDISILYDKIVFSGNQYIAAVPAINPVHAAFRGSTLRAKGMLLIDYWKNLLGVTNPEKYFNAGVMLLNLDKMREIHFSELFMDKLNELQDPPGQDQDIFNALGSKEVILLSQKWNFMGYGDWKNFDKWLPKDLANDFYVAQKNPMIIHFASAKKPWDVVTMEHAEYFWKYAKSTPFYEIILCTMMMQNSVLAGSRVVGGGAKVQSTSSKSASNCNDRKGKLAHSIRRLLSRLVFRKRR